MRQPEKMPLRASDAALKNARSFGIARISVLLAILVFCSSEKAAALDPHSRVSQYGHTAWRIQDGFISQATSITQTADGYIWIATLSGLFRFDGVKFSLWTPPNNQSLPSSVPNYLLGARDGSLWIGTTAGLSHLKAGQLTNYLTTKQSPGISAILEDHEGKIWVTRYRVNDGMGTLCWPTDSALECYGKKDGNPAPYALGIAQDSAGRIWFACKMLCRWEHGSFITYFDEQFKNPAGNGVIEVAAGPSGEIWASFDGIGPKLGLQHFSNGKWASYIVPGFDGRTGRSPCLFVDSKKTLWIGTDSNGLYHVHDGFADHYGTTDGLSGKAVVAFYEDREGNLWVATDRGIDLFRDNSVISFSMSQGLAEDEVSSVLAINGDSVWVAGTKGVDVIRAEPFSSIRRQNVPGHDVTTMFADSRGQVWLGIDDRVFAYKNGQYFELKKADGSTLGEIGRPQSFAEDPEGNVWVLSQSARGVGHLDLLLIRDQRLRQDFRFKYSEVRYLAADRRAGVWTLSRVGELTHYVGGSVQESVKLGVSTFSLDVDPDNVVWTATNKGLFRWNNGQLTVMDVKNGLPCSRIYSMIRDDQGSYWLRTQCGIVRVSAEEWQRWLKSPETKISLAVFGVLDGAQPGTNNEEPSVAKSQDGRLWFASDYSVQMVDPNRPSNPLPPPVHIEDMVADHKTYESLEELELPHLQGELEIDYTGLSFKIPQRVFFRYKLEGHDEDWQEAGTRRQAFYNDLRPGKYRFRVIASNNDGVWNEQGAALDFAIVPAWYQTNWFRTLYVVAFVGLMAFFYQLRVRQLQRQFAIGVEARVDERTRIARDLHDTLLQSFQGLMLRLQLVEDLLPEGKAKNQLEQTLQRADQAIREGRRAVYNLRCSTAAPTNLAQAVRSLGDEFATDNPAAFHLEVEGAARDLNPIIRDELYLITREALRNAFSHARAGHIEAEITYGERAFRLRIRDDGEGIPTPILEEGRPGHYGLLGMRERAKQVGGKLDFWSRAGAGTEIELSIPGSIAYCTSVPRSVFPQFGKKPE